MHTNAPIRIAAILGAFVLIGGLTVAAMAVTRNTADQAPATLASDPRTDSPRSVDTGSRQEAFRDARTLAVAPDDASGSNDGSGPAGEIEARNDRSGSDEQGSYEGRSGPDDARSDDEQTGSDDGGLDDHGSTFDDDQSEDESPDGSGDSSEGDDDVEEDQSGHSGDDGTQGESGSPSSNEH